MNPQVLKIRIPENINPVEAIIKDEKRFLHALCQYHQIALPYLKTEDIINTIALAAGEVVNQRVLYHFFMDYMPDEKARTLLEDLLDKMNTLVDSTFGRTTEEMQDLIEQREKYCAVMDNIVNAYSSLTKHLKSKVIE